MPHHPLSNQRSGPRSSQHQGERRPNASIASNPGPTLVRDLFGIGTQKDVSDFFAKPVGQRLSEVITAQEKSSKFQ